MTPAEFREARKTLGLTQQQAAIMLGYTGTRAVQTISDIERGKMRAPAYAIRLLRLYLSLQSEAPHLLPEDWLGTTATITRAR